MYTYKAEVTRVVDGDTIDVMIDLGFATFTKARLRFARINAPEIRPRKKNFPTEKARLAEKSRGLVAKELIKNFIEVNKNQVTIETTKKGKYGRWIAEIWVLGANLSDLLLKEGLAKKVNY